MHLCIDVSGITRCRNLTMQEQRQLEVLDELEGSDEAFKRKQVSSEGNAVCMDMNSLNTSWGA